MHTNLRIIMCHRYVLWFGRSLILWQSLILASMRYTFIVHDYCVSKLGFITIKRRFMILAITGPGLITLAFEAGRFEFGEHSSYNGAGTQLVTLGAQFIMISRVG